MSDMSAVGQYMAAMALGISVVNLKSSVVGLGKATWRAWVKSAFLAARLGRAPKVAAAASRAALGSTSPTKETSKKLSVSSGVSQALSSARERFCMSSILG